MSKTFLQVKACDPRLKLVLLGLILVAFLFQPACVISPAERRVSLANIAQGEKHIPDWPERGALRIAVSSRITPRETLDVYQEILDYIGERLGRPVELVQRKTYAEVNDLLRRGLIDAAFICTQAYIEGKHDFGLELLAAPVIRGKPEYYSYIIVQKDSPIQEFSQLRGKSFAFVDPMSNTGKLFPTYLLLKMGETPDSFFSSYVFTYAHSSSIRAVAHGLVDGAAVDSLVWDYTNMVDPKHTSRTRIIYRSPPYGSPPIVMPPNADPELKSRLQAVLLDMDRDEIGSQILRKAGIDRFVALDDSAYESVRSMLAVLAQISKEQ